jgi:hypothetical protein
MRRRNRWPSGATEGIPQAASPPPCITEGTDQGKTTLHGRYIPRAGTRKSEAIAWLDCLAWQQTDYYSATRILKLETTNIETFE